MPQVSFADRVAIVTGAGGGLGRTYALEIARRGGAVVVNDLGGSVAGEGRSTAMADKVVEEIRAAGGRAVASYDSVSTTEGAQAIVQTALNGFGRVDALINNAGTLRNAWFEDFSLEDRDAMFDVHLAGAFNVTQAAWPHLKRQRYGRVVFTSSGAGMLGNPTQSAYGAAKAAVVGLMHVLALEGAEYGVLCNALMPNAAGRMATQMDPDIIGANMPFIERLSYGFDPEFVTGVAVYLASEACQTGHAIYSALAGRISRTFIGVTHGWQGPQGAPPDADAIAEHIEQIRDPLRGFDIPDNLIDEYRLLAMQAPPQYVATGC